MLTYIKFKREHHLDFNRSLFLSIANRQSAMIKCNYIYRYMYFVTILYFFKNKYQNLVTKFSDNFQSFND